MGKPYHNKGKLSNTKKTLVEKLAVAITYIKYCIHK